MRPKVLVLCLLLVFLALPGCARPPEPPAGKYSFTDALGRQVTVDNPQRVAALLGGFAETWLLAGGTLAGVTQDALEERQLELDADAALIGLHNSPSAEALLALQPDFVLLSSETASHLELLPLLESAGIPCAYFSVTHFEDYLDMLFTCTQITGRSDLYQTNGLDVQAAVCAVQKAAPQGVPPSALLLITYSGGAAAQNSGSMAGLMLLEMGFSNLADESPSLLREFSLESVIDRDPDYIFVIPMGNSRELAKRNLNETLEGHPAWGQLTAVKNGRYILLPKELFLYKPNHRWAEAYAFLEELLHE